MFPVGGQPTEPYLPSLIRVHSRNSRFPSPHKAQSTKHQAPSTTINTQPTTPNPQLTERVITPISGIGSIREILISLIRDFPQARQLAWRLFLRDTRAQYRQSLLGFAWLFLPPIATTAVWIFLNAQNVVTVDSGGVPYPLFVLTGTVLWNAFNGSLSGSIGVISEAGGMVSKLNFPHEALVFCAFLKVLLNTAIQSLLLVPTFFVLGFNPGIGVLAIPAGLLALILLGFSVGVFLIPLGTLYSDVSRAVQMALRFAFFLTPVVYPIPDTKLGEWLGAVNPISPLLVTARGLALGGEDNMWLQSIITFGGCLVFLLFGTFLYKLAMPRLIERMSA